MEEISVIGTGVKKVFNRRTIFSDIDFTLTNHQSLAITGKNGTGKSTLVKIIAGVLSSTSGTVSFTFTNHVVTPADVYSLIGFVAPYLQLYDEFSGWENLDIVRRMRGLRVADDRLDQLVERVRLGPRKHDRVRTYSSGMKQRLKYAFALLHAPPVLLLDEPTSNLDTDGVAIVYDIIQEQQENGIVIVAANDEEDVRLCEAVITLDAHGEGGLVAGWR